MARRKEKAAAARAGEQAARAMLHVRDTQSDVLVRPACEIDPEDWWYYQEQAVRMARMACYHAFKARPELKPLDSYDRAVAEHKAMTKAAAR